MKIVKKLIAALMVLGALAALIAASQIYALYAPEEEGGEAA